MLFAIASIFLSAILMTQANVIESDVTNTEPLSEELFIYDVTSDASVAELKGSLKSAGVEVRHSFQVLGTRQYFFVIVGDLSQLTFPEDSEVTQYPVQHIIDYYKLMGTTGWDANDTKEALHDKNLLSIVWENILPFGTSTAELKKLAHACARLYSPANENSKPVMYSVVGRYPPKFILFMNLDENSFQKALLHGLDCQGGPGNNVISSLRIRKV